MNSINREKDYPFARWMSWLFLSASILLLTYTYYRAEITFQGDKQSYYFKYYLISLTGTLFWGFVLRLREGIRANIVTLFTSLVVGLYLFEGGLTLLGLGQVKPNIYSIWSANIARTAAAADLGIEYDTRTILEVSEELKGKGVDAVPTVHGSKFLQIIGTNNEDFDHLFPLGGVSNKTTIYNNESGKYLIYKSDRYGFNNPDSQWGSQTIEWLLLGDSFTHGSAVQPGQEMAGQLRSITGNPAISLGIGGNGPLLEYAALVEYGKSLAPVKVLWIYCEWNDIVDLQVEKLNPLLMQYMEDGFSQNLINRQKEIDNWLEKYLSLEKIEVKQQTKAQAQAQEKIYEQLFKTRWIRLYAIRNIIGFDVVVDDYVKAGNIDVDDPTFAKILTKAKAEVEAWEGELYFVYLPVYWRYNQTALSQDKFRKKAEVINLVKGLNIPVIDIHQEVFADHPDPLALFPFRLPGHYIADGYSEVAKAIVTSVYKYEQSNK